VTNGRKASGVRAGGGCTSIATTRTSGAGGATGACANDEIAINNAAHSSVAGLHIHIDQKLLQP
jgi:hypothetical protein